MNPVATTDHISRLRTTATDTPVIKRERANAVAGQFEEIFVQQFIAGMRRTASIGEDSSMFGSGPGSDTYTKWFDEHFANHLLDNGGLGVRDTLLRDWERAGQIPAEAETKGNLDVTA